MEAIRGLAQIFVLKSAYHMIIQKFQLIEDECRIYAPVK